MRTIDLLNLINQKLDECSKNTNYVTQVLHKYFLRKLKDLLDYITHNGKYELSRTHDHNKLRSFLKEFYDTVKDTDALPLHTPNSDLSKIMMHVAEMLEKFFNDSNRFELLMPSIQVSDYVVSGISLDDPKLKLNDFVMSDDNKCLIEVLSCLKFASEDGVLKHCCLFNGEIKILSPTEKQRVINHSKAAKEYWEAIEAKIQITLEGNSFGAVLMRLANDLYNGGVYGKRDGSELNSGENANVGILNFFLWYDKLTKEEKNYLNEKKSQQLTLKDLILRLKRPNHQSYTETIYCVSIISQYIKDILKENPELYDKYPQNAEAGSLKIGLAVEAIANAEYRLTNALANPDYKVTATYYDKSKSTQLFYNLMKLPDLKDYVSNRTVNEMRRYKNESHGTLITARREAFRQPQEQDRGRHRHRPQS